MNQAIHPFPIESEAVQPTVSVCMISYNHGKFIAQAIESILSQEVDFPIELVIGDDCSTDNTFDICEAYARKDPRVKLLSRERNLGVMPNFSRTLQACTGKYIAVCEGDDYWVAPSKLAIQVSFLESHPDYAGATHQSDVLIGDRVARKFKLGVPETILTKDLIAGRLFHTASVLFRREAVELFCGAPLVLSCDRLLNLCITFAGKIHYSEETMCVYRLHGGGMSSNVTVEQLRLDLSSIDYLKSIEPTFPAQQYRSYVFATIGLCQRATWVQRVYYMAVSFLLSFATFPRNLGLYGTHFIRMCSRKLSHR
ncbi:glycosyltransferase [Ramlibacter albus]|uniref:Glycosyltransferase n=1 Tax=Ramlibacter albus TaxID=2079448 RepID=A0A923MCB4_9BURK|nr:glycosyltransferase [Ramlibacter albus]